MVRFVTANQVVTKLAEGLTTEVFQTAMNDCLKDLNERKVYFRVCRRNRFSDVLHTQTDSKVDDFMEYLNALGEKFTSLGVPEFRFERDSEKVKIDVGMVPLTNPGRINWSPEDWIDDTEYRTITNDVESANSGIVITAKPLWVGGVWKMHVQKQSTAGIILVVEKTKEVMVMMSAESPRIVICGKPRFCRA